MTWACWRSRRCSPKLAGTRPGFRPWLLLLSGCCRSSGRSTPASAQDPGRGGRRGDHPDRRVARAIQTRCRRARRGVDSARPGRHRSGVKVGVPYAAAARWILVPAGTPRAGSGGGDGRALSSPWSSPMPTGCPASGPAARPACPSTHCGWTGRPSLAFWTAARLPTCASSRWRGVRGGGRRAGGRAGSHHRAPAHP